MINRLAQAKWRRRQFVVLLVILGNVADISATHEDGSYANQFAIRVNNGKRETAEEVAEEHGFTVTRELSNINVFLLEHRNVAHRSKRSAVNELQFLQNDKRVTYAQQDEELIREKRHVIHDKQKEFLIRSITDDSVYDRVEPATLSRRDDINPQPAINYNDPKFKDMWYLINEGQSGGEVGLDMNVAVVWENGFTGKGVVVTILDDGFDYTHPDLIDNYDPKASANMNNPNDTTNDPMPMLDDDDNSHGTRCAGEIAGKADNGVCGVGIAHGCNVGGVRLLDGPIYDSMEADAINFNMQYIDIYSASWGPTDDGAHMEGPHNLTFEAMKKGVREGRNGLGSIYVWATGNGGARGDHCGADGYVSSPMTLSIGSVNDWGRSPYWSEKCSSTLAVVPSGGSDYVRQEMDTGKIKLKVITTDIRGGCIENFQGTSAAAPLATGCIATVLEANPLLTWRDVQHVVVRSARIPSADTTWTINGAGYHVSDQFGFGTMDCGKMVELAQNWQNVPERRLCNTTKTNYQILKRGGKIVDKVEIDGCHGEESIDRLEHVQLYLKMSTDVRGETEILLISPANTRSTLLGTRTPDKQGGEWEFTFSTVHSWDESPRGTWTLMIINKPFQAKTENKDGTKLFKIEDPSDTVGYIKEWSLILWGTHGARHNRAHLGVKRTQEASYPSAEQILRIKRDEVEISRRVQVKRVQPNFLDKKSDIKNKDEREKLMRREQLMRRLYDLLHGHGARTVRKRVLDTPSSRMVQKRNKVDDVDDMNEMIDYVTTKLKRILSEK